MTKIEQTIHEIKTHPNCKFEAGLLQPVIQHYESELDRRKEEINLLKQQATHADKSCDLQFKELQEKCGHQKELIGRLIASLQSCANPEAHDTILRAIEES